MQTTEYVRESSTIFTFTEHTLYSTIICEFDECMFPGTIIHANQPAITTLGYTHDELATFSFKDICSTSISLCNGQQDSTFQFQTHLKKKDNTLILCNFHARTLSYIGSDTNQIQITFTPIESTSDNLVLIPGVIDNNKNELLNICSHGVAHDINNSINLITLSTDLLEEIISETIQQITLHAPSALIRGMNIHELTKTTEYLFSNFNKSSQKINTTMQAFFQFIRNNSNSISNTYDVRKILQTVVSITESEIRKCSSELKFEPTQWIIKRTGDILQIQQALVNLILFICKNTNGCTHPMNIITILNPEQNAFCISISHSGCNPVPESFVDIFNDKTSPGRLEFNKHPLIIAQSLILLNGGSLDIKSEDPSGIEFNITFSTLCNVY